MYNKLKGRKGVFETAYFKEKKKEEKQFLYRPKLNNPSPQKELKLDYFQERAIMALRSGSSVIVAAPTGTGKTLIAEKLLADVLTKEKGAIYTSPIKALSNQKYRDFSALFGRDKVGLITGDLSINEGAPVLVMTTEIFRNWCFAQPGELQNISHVVFDEMHYLDDPARGTVWEESVIFAPSHLRLLGLSATIPNIYEIAAWIKEVRHDEVKVIVEKKRVVPLKTNWINHNGNILTAAEVQAEIKAQSDACKQRYRKERKNE